jgi:hypothetical protein
MIQKSRFAGFFCIIFHLTRRPSCLFFSKKNKFLALKLAPPPPYKRRPAPNLRVKIKNSFPQVFLRQYVTSINSGLIVTEQRGGPT